MIGMEGGRERGGRREEEESQGKRERATCLMIDEEK
jgi:hypothetical protein